MRDTGHRLESERYLTSLRRDGAALADAAERDLHADVPGCPGWSVADLVWHTGGLHYFWASIASEGLQDPRAVEAPPRPPDERLIDWYRSNLERTVDALEKADPTTSVWSWSREKNVAWVRRRMAHETAIHRWDTQCATGSEQPIDPRLAVDGIDEFFEFFVTGTKDAADVSIHLHATDIDGEWMVKIEGGELYVSHAHAKGNAAVQGEASDLLLLLWGRIPEASVRVHGDRTALYRFLESANLG